MHATLFNKGFKWRNHGLFKTIMGSLKPGMTMLNGLRNGTVDISTPERSNHDFEISNKRLSVEQTIVGLAQFSKAGYFKIMEKILDTCWKIVYVCYFRVPRRNQCCTAGTLHNDTKAARRRAAFSLIKTA